MLLSRNWSTSNWHRRGEVAKLLQFLTRREHHEGSLLIERLDNDALEQSLFFGDVLAFCIWVHDNEGRECSHAHGW